jgi:hypothetical protein
VLALVIRANLRAAQERARSTAAMASIAKLALVLLPKPGALRVAGGLQLGLGLALILLPMLRRNKG